MYIVICRKKLIAASKEYQTLFERLGEACDGHVTMSHPFVMDIGFDIRVEFRSSDPCRIAGIRPDYYNSDDELCSEYLAQAASKCNGKELKSIDEVFDVVVKDYLSYPPVSNFNWR